MANNYRVTDYFSHIDMGFLNRRLAITALGPIRQDFIENQRSGSDHITQLSNDHLLVTMLIDVFSTLKAPTLAEALTLGVPKHIFMSTERLKSCADVYKSPHVNQAVEVEFDYGKPICLAYNTSHTVSDTGRMTLAKGYKAKYRHAIIGLLHDKGDRFEIEPIVIGAPWLDHPRNDRGSEVMWFGYDYGEIHPEDIAEFSDMKSIDVSDANEWMDIMKQIPEAYVKESIAKLLKEPVKADWGGEENDHFSANITVSGRKRTAAFLLKGPAKFKEMTPAMCGKNGDQIHRLSNSGAYVSVVQHSHLIGPAVRDTVRAFTVQPGRSRKFCIMDGQATYRLLKAYNLLPQ
jgi:hypothetical protein